jgi:hypothetical protein
MKSQDYEVTSWADGFGNWHAKATFIEPLGNTGEAERVAENAHRSCRRVIRNEISHRMAGRPRRLSYYVSANELEPGLGRLRSITISEQIGIKNEAK